MRTLLLSLSLMLGLGLAQSLADFAPADAILTLGISQQGVEGSSLKDDLAQLDWEKARLSFEKFMNFLDQSGLGAKIEREFDINDLSEMVRSIQDMLEGRGDMYDEMLAFCPALENVDMENFSPIGEEALLTVGLNAMMMMPSVTAIARMSDEQAAVAASIQENLIACAQEEMGEEAVVVLEEGETKLYVMADGSDMPIIISSVGNIYIASSNPDAAKLVVRLAHGSDEPSLADSPLHGRIAQMMQEKGLSLSLDFAAVADIASNFRSEVVEEEDSPQAYLFDRGMSALRTLGGMAARAGLHDEGILIESLTAINPEGGDSDLASLMLCQTCNVTVPTLAPASSTTVSSQYLAIGEFIDYLQTWVDGLSPYIGEMNLKEFLAMQLGVDLDKMLLSWLGKEMHMVTLEPVSQKLSTLVYTPAQAVIIPVTDLEAAKASSSDWNNLWPMIQMLSSMISEQEDMPFDLTGYIDQDSYSYEGIDITRYRFSANFDMAMAYVDSNLVFALPASAMETIIHTAQGDIANILSNPDYNASIAAAPNPVAARSYSNSQEQMGALAELFGIFSQPLAFAMRAGLDAVLAEETSYSDYDYTQESVSYFDEDLTNISISEFDVTQGSFNGNFSDSGEVSGADQSAAYYEITGLNAGDTVAVSIESADFDTYLSLIAISDEGSNVVMENDDFEGDYTRSRIAFTAAEGVRYVAEATSYGRASSGSYTVKVEITESPDADMEFFSSYPASYFAESIPLALGESASSNLSVAEAVRMAHYYQLNGLNAGDTVTVRLDSNDFDTYIYVIDATNLNYVAENDDFDGSYASSQVSFSVEEGVSYLVKATSFDGMGVGNYDLTVSVEGAMTETSETVDSVEEAVELSPEEIKALAPNFSDMLALTDMAPEVLEVIAKHLSYDEGYSQVDGDNIYRRALIRVDW